MTYTYSIPSSAFVVGTNTMWISVASGTTSTGFLSPGYAYDCVELDLPAALPSAPAGLTATARETQANLSWTAVSGAASYHVKRATTSGGPYTTVATGVTGTTYSDTGLANGTTCYYVVSAVNSSGQSGNSNQVSITTAPLGVTSLTATAGDAQVVLNWTAASGATSYNLQRSTTAGGPYSLAPNVVGTTYIDTGLTNGTTYYYVVSSLNAAGESAASGEVSATPVAPAPVAPTLTGFTPTSGPVGTKVTITGTGFTGATAVTFYNAKSASFTIVNSTTITATVPTGASSGTIKVTTAGGTATSTGKFTVKAR